MEKPNKKITFYIESLGCYKNLVDSEIATDNLIKNGFSKVESPNDADILLVNTCGFINDAKEESINTILRLASAKGNRKLVVMGCLSERYKKELKDLIPEIDIILGANQWDNLANVIKNNREYAIDDKLFMYDKPIKNRYLEPEHIAFVKISEGCSNKCAFCTIPSIRGPYRSRKIEVIQEEISALVKKGVKEINLISQDSSFYGMDIYGEKKLYELLANIDRISGDYWIRIFYQNIDLFDERIIELINNSVHILPYFDIPVQHYSELMNRGSNSKRIDTIFNLIREIIPDSIIRTSLIVGFPGETRADFNLLKEFLKRNHPDRVGIFAYSDEEGTAAYLLPDKVSETTKKNRLKKLLEITAENSLKRNLSLVGKKLRVLVDSKEGNIYIARSKYDAYEVDDSVIIEDRNLKVGQFYDAVITDATEFDLFGKIVS
ncbi:MAG: 30S ribosomal protein S12 methylthiotransferase RimO [Proteobacteria bacterium]|nr:30S ribosomal protein S12 methylthiotransferase RimO [Pseudomonadota bacterium]